MKPLTQLLADSLRHRDPEDQQRFVRERIGAAAVASRLRIFDPSKPSSPDRVVIVFAPYVSAELELLDAIDDRLAASHEIVEIADVRTLESIEQFHAIVPGIGRVPQTPVIAIWNSGQLAESAWGNEAMSKLRLRYMRP